MPCNLTADRQVLEMIDLAGEEYKLYYRLPTNPQRMAFSASLYTKSGKKTVIKSNIFAEEAALGKKLVTGFSESYFMDGDDFISSNPSEAHYRANWKDLLAAARPSDLAAVARAALRPSQVSAGDEDEIDLLAGAEGEADADAEEATEETDAPLSSSSEASSNDAPPQTDATVNA
ncbi:hypothetical protein JCM15519_38770 [Fundidesulfovibrio butyratiphilus]